MAITMMMIHYYENAFNVVLKNNDGKSDFSVNITVLVVVVFCLTMIQSRRAVVAMEHHRNNCVNCQNEEARNNDEEKWQEKG